MWPEEHRRTVLEGRCGPARGCARDDPPILRGQLLPCTRKPAGQSVGAFLPTKSERRTNQRDEEVIRRWKEERCPSLRRGIEKGNTVLFGSQSDFYLLPTVMHTYAPVGQMPVLCEPLSRDHLWAMSGITLEGKLLMMEQERAFKGEDWPGF